MFIDYMNNNILAEIFENYFDVDLRLRSFCVMLNEKNYSGSFHIDHFINLAQKMSRGFEPRMTLDLGSFSIVYNF